MEVRKLMQRAMATRTVIPAFNIAHLPMMEQIVRALRDTECIGMITVARPDWMKFGAGSPAAVREEYERVKDERYTHLHMDHVPVIDEDDQSVDFEAVIFDAIELGYESIMIDGSRLPLDENISVTKKVVDMAHDGDKYIPVEAELGAVMGHEEGPIPPYEELFSTGRGFTDPTEAGQFLSETGVDWLSVAIGNIHGAVSKAKKDDKKVRARLNIDHLESIRDVIGIPIVLHGGSGIRKESILDGIQHGITKINIATAVRQVYEAGAKSSVEAGCEAVYETAVKLIREDLECEGSARILGGA